MRALALLLVPALAHAGADEKGFRIGSNYFGISQSDGAAAAGFPGVHGQPGLSLGSFLILRGNANVALQLEGNLSDKRAGTENCAPCVPVATLSLWFFEIPVLLRVDLLPARTKFHLDLGPELVLSLGGAQKAAMTGASSQLDLTPANFGGMVGAGLEFGAGPGGITLDVRYKRWGLPITNNDEPNQRLKSTNQVVIEVGYAFP